MIECSRRVGKYFQNPCVGDNQVKLATKTHYDDVSKPIGELMYMLSVGQGHYRLVDDDLRCNMGVWPMKSPYVHTHMLDIASHAIANYQYLGAEVRKGKDKRNATLNAMEGMLQSMEYIIDELKAMNRNNPSGKQKRMQEHLDRMATAYWDCVEEFGKDRHGGLLCRSIFRLIEEAKKKPTP